MTICGETDGIKKKKEKRRPSRYNLVSSLGEVQEGIAHKVAKGEPPLAISCGARELCLIE
jgi:hypothetical protein